MIKESFNLGLPLHGIFPKNWKEVVKQFDYVSFRNVDHFKSVVSQLTQKKDDMCNMSYATALQRLLVGKGDMEPSEQLSIRNLVRSNLHRRGLITEETYENYRYTVDGTQVGVDVGKFTNGEPDCVLSPAVQYIDFFYELYISISYPWNISNEDIQKNIAKLLATVEELERQHIFIKIVLVLPIRKVNKKNDNYFFSSIPLFSHKQRKTIEGMSSILNDKLLRKFYFAILEDLYGDSISYGYGYPAELPAAMNVGNEFDEIEFFTDVVKTVGA